MLRRFSGEVPPKTGRPFLGGLLASENVSEVFALDEASEQGLHVPSGRLDQSRDGL